MANLHEEAYLGLYLYKLKYLRNLLHDCEKLTGNLPLYRKERNDLYNDIIRRVAELKEIREVCPSIFEE